MPKVFLTGATGNVGEPVVAELLSRGLEILALVRRPTDLDGCQTVVGELAYIRMLANEISEVDAVIHLASPRTNDRQSVIYDDIVATGYLLDAWHRGNFIYASSQTVYGIPKQTLTESSPLDPYACWYDLGKFCNEAQLRMARISGNRGAAVSLRLAVLFGSGGRRRDRQFLIDVYKQCLLGQVFVFDSYEGLETYGSSFIGDKDLGRAVADSLSIKESDCFNIASGFCTWRNLIEVMNRYAGTHSGFTVRPGAKAGRGEYRLPQSISVLDTRKFEFSAGFTPRQSIDELIERFVCAEKTSSE